MRSRWLNVQILGRARLTPIVLAIAILTTSCGLFRPSELNFRTDSRLEFTAPPARTLVRTPLHVAWQIHDFQIVPPHSAPPTKGAGYFAIFVDRSPIKPARTMRDVASRDETCLARPGCPDEVYLEQRQIFTTTNEDLTIPQIPSIPGDSEKIQQHTVTVVLMDTSGHRIGESGWELDLRMRKVGL